MSIVVIIPTTGSSELYKAVESVLNQTIPTTCYVVIDGKQYEEQANAILSSFNNPLLKVTCLADNVGGNGFYGHRIYAAFSHLVNEDFVLFLDQDCWFDNNHVESCVNLITTHSLQWCHTLRKIIHKDGTYICNDDCESLGKTLNVAKQHHVDTNAYCIKREHLIQLAPAWHGGWGQDRVFLATLMQYMPRFLSTNQYTLNYRLAGNPGSVSEQFFINGNNSFKKN